MLNFTKRPIPASAGDIGNWGLVMEITAFIGLFINAGLLAFTSKAIETD